MSQPTLSATHMRALLKLMRTKSAPEKERIRARARRYIQKHIDKLPKHMRRAMSLIETRRGGLSVEYMMSDEFNDMMTTFDLYVAYYLAAVLAMSVGYAIFIDKGPQAEWLAEKQAAMQAAMQAIQAEQQAAARAVQAESLRARIEASLETRRAALLAGRAAIQSHADQVNWDGEYVEFRVALHNAGQVWQDADQAWQDAMQARQDAVHARYAVEQADRGKTIKTRKILVEQARQDAAHARDAARSMRGRHNEYQDSRADVSELIFSSRDIRTKKQVMDLNGCGIPRELVEKIFDFIADENRFVGTERAEVPYRANFVAVLPDKIAIAGDDEIRIVNYMTRKTVAIAKYKTKLMCAMGDGSVAFSSDRSVYKWTQQYDPVQMFKHTSIALAETSGGEVLSASPNNVRSPLVRYTDALMVGRIILKLVAARNFIAIRTDDGIQVYTRDGTVHSWWYCEPSKNSTLIAHGDNLILMNENLIYVWYIWDLRFDQRYGDGTNNRVHMLLGTSLVLLGENIAYVPISIREVHFVPIKGGPPRVIKLSEHLDLVCTLGDMFVSKRANIVRVHRASDCAVVATLRHENNVNQVIELADERLLTIDEDRVIRVWE